MTKKLLALITGLLLALAALPAFAAYPEKPITLIVPFGAGGATDVPARIIANMMEKKLGQTIVVQNIAGAGGTQGMAQVSGAAADGYTLGYTPTGVVCLQPHVQNIPFGRDSFDFIGMAVRQPVVVMSSKKAPWKDFTSMVETIKKAPNKYIVAVTGIGNMTHVPMVELAKHFGLQFKIIPYRSTAEVMKDLITGRVHLHADTPVPLSQFDVYGLIQFADKRAEGLDFPTTTEVGFDKTYSHWQGFVAPKGLPADVLSTLSTTLQSVIESPEFAAEAKKLNTMAYWLTSAAFKALF